MPRNFVTLNYVLRNAHTIRFEDRPEKYKFGTKNYGDIPGLYNKSDGDPWDVFAPGYSYTLSTSNSYRIKKILGILLLENGNHKIAVKLYASQAPGFNYKRAMKEIDTYCSKYTRGMRLRGEYLSFLDPQ